MTTIEKQSKIRKFQKDCVENMIDVYDKYPEFVKYLDDNFWNLLVSDTDVRNLAYERRNLSLK